MKQLWLKYLLVFICVFAVLERTGVTASSLLLKADIHHTDCYCDSNDDTTEGSETKVTNLKEYWAIHQPVQLPLVFASLKSVIYRGEKLCAHLAWVPPVPTPPPNSLV